MNKEEFRNMYDNFQCKWKIENIEEIKKIWDKYADAILSDDGLPFDKEANGSISWLKSSDTDKDYLPYFIERIKSFGSARPGSSLQYMIYKHYGNGDHKGLYYDKYRKGYVEALTDAKKDYQNKIAPLLKEILNADSFDELRKCENDVMYKEFYAKQFLRKLSVLKSIFNDTVDYKNSLLWIYSENVVDKLVEIFELSTQLTEDSTFFEKSYKICRKTEEYADIKLSALTIDCSEDVKKLCKLNEFLWALASRQVNGFTDFESPNVIYHGAPGTGKTYTTLQTVRMLCGGNSKRYKYCQFHPSYSYQDFIEGIKPMGIVGGNVNLEVVNGIFKQFCIDVKIENENTYLKLKDNYKDYPHYYFIVDEINRGDLSRIFGETFSLLEPDYRDKDFSNNYQLNENLIVTPLSGVIKASEKKEKLIYKEINGEPYFGIPFNIHFIGLMNDVDRSIDTFDLALRRRFKWIAKCCDYDVIQNCIDEPEIAEKYRKACENLNKFICDKNNGFGLGANYKLGQSYFMKIGNPKTMKDLASCKEKVFNNYIETTLREYVREICDEQEIDEKIKMAKDKFLQEDIKKNQPKETPDSFGENDDE